MVFASLKESDEEYARCRGCGDLMKGVLKRTKPLLRELCASCEKVEERANNE